VNTVARVSLSAAVVLATGGILILMTLYLWVGLVVCALALLWLGYEVYESFS
jgi:hypothetical protein